MLAKLTQEHYSFITALSQLRRVVFGTISVCLLWPPCVADADIIFLPCGFFFFYVLSSSFPRLNSAVADGMSTVLPHMVWP